MEKVILKPWDEMVKKADSLAKANNNTKDIDSLLNPIKIKFYELFTELLKDEFEPTEFFELLLKLFLIAYPKQEDVFAYFQPEKFLLDYKNKPRPAALKEYLFSLQLNEKQLHRLLYTFLIILTEAEKKDKEFVYSRIFIETELGKLKKKTKEATTPVLTITKIEESTLEQNKKIAGEYLEFLSGCNVHNEKIMSDTDFHSLKDYTFHLIEFKTVPKKIKPIPQTKISSDFIRYTFYQIQFNIYGKKNQVRNIWIDFLHNVFGQFKEIEKNTTYQKFATRPKSYQQDIRKQ
jgi:hypothetical protein